MSDPTTPPDPRQPDDDRYHDRIDISDEDDDFEYEVEPVDEEMIARQQARARHEVAKAEAALDVDAVYRELDKRDDFDAAFEKFRGRFSLKTLLIAMTVLAILMGIFGSGLLNGATFAGFICLSLLVLGSAHTWLNYQERKRREAVLIKRDRQLRRARHIAAHPDVPYDDSDEEELPDANDPLTDLFAALTRWPRFSLLELLLAMTAASVMLALLVVSGSLSRAAIAMGAVALTGFGLQAADIDIPKPLLLAWWLTLLAYCLFTLAAIAVG